MSQLPTSAHTHPKIVKNTNKHLHKTQTCCTNPQLSTPSQKTCHTYPELPTSSQKNVTGKKLVFTRTTQIKPTKKSGSSIATHTQPFLHTFSQKNTTSIQIEPKKDILTQINPQPPKKIISSCNTHLHEVVYSHIKQDFYAFYRCTFLCRILTQNAQKLILKTEKLSQKNKS